MAEYFLIITICIIIVISPIVSKLTKAPIVVIEIVLGLIAGYLGLLYDNEILKLVAKFGFVYLMFLAGLEINIKLIKYVKTNMAWSVALYIISLYTLSGVVCWIFNLGVTYFLAFPICSIGMMMMLIKEYGKDEEWLNLVLAIGIIGEVVSILVLTLFGGWVEYGFGTGFFISILKIILVIISTIIVLRLFYLAFWWYPELKKFFIPDIHTDRFDQDIRFSISLLLTLTAVMLLLKIDVVLGAFTAGFFLKMFFNQKHELLEKIESFGFGFFVPIFFIYTGSTVKLDMINMNILLNALFIIASIVSIRLISSYLVLFKYLKFKQTTLFGLADSMPLTFIVAVSTISYQYGIITQEEYFSFIIASMIDGLILIVLIRKLYNWFNINNSATNKTPTTM